MRNMPVMREYFQEATSFWSTRGTVSLLAQRSAQAACDITVLIEGTVARVRNGSEITSRLAANYGEIQEVSANVGGVIKEIASAAGGRRGWTK